MINLIIFINLLVLTVLYTLLAQTILLKFGFDFNFWKTILLMSLFRILLGTNNQKHKDQDDFQKYYSHLVVISSIQLIIGYIFYLIIW